MIRPVFALGFVALIVGCSSQEADPASTEGADLTSAKLAMTETPGGHLDPFGCRHYMKLSLSSNSATLSPALDSADPQDMDSDGSCGGEELPPGADSRYPLRLASKSDCGASIYTGTINWSESGAVKRTLELTDFRGSTCTYDSLVVAKISSTYQAETHVVATYYSVDR